MRDVKLKICGVKDPDLAAQAVDLGVDYIGLIFCPQSKRYVKLDLAKAISAAVHAKKAKVIPVFVEQAADEILDVAAELNADLIQLHGVEAIRAYSDVCDHYPCVVAQHLCDNVSMLNPLRDFLLYDYPIPGSGSVFDWKNISVDNAFRSFIAGGINVNNAQEAIAHFHPFALDVSSGVENANGEKDIDLIKALVDMISGGNRGKN